MNELILWAPELSIISFVSRGVWWGALTLSLPSAERALYSLECAFHPVFSLTSGTCRLDYRRPENR